MKKPGHGIFEFLETEEIPRSYADGIDHVDFFTKYIVTTWYHKGYIRSDGNIMITIDNNLFLVKNEKLKNIYKLDFDLFCDLILKEPYIIKDDCRIVN